MIIMALTDYFYQKKHPVSKMLTGRLDIDLSALLRTLHIIIEDELESVACTNNPGTNINVTNTALLIREIQSYVFHRVEL